MALVGIVLLALLLLSVPMVIFRQFFSFIGRYSLSAFKTAPVRGKVPAPS
ncbi:MAG: hypothetical protein M3544_04125 [Pseudomonadota bacterium]|nr:hypothetical protein [Pseudomonadota bacterium]